MVTSLLLAYDTHIWDEDELVCLSALHPPAVIEEVQWSNSGDERS